MKTRLTILYDHIAGRRHTFKVLFVRVSILFVRVGEFNWIQILARRELSTGIASLWVVDNRGVVISFTVQWVGELLLLLKLSAGVRDLVGIWRT